MKRIVMFTILLLLCGCSNAKIKRQREIEELAEKLDDLIEWQEELESDISSMQDKVSEYAAEKHNFIK